MNPCLNEAHKGYAHIALSRLGPGSGVYTHPEGYPGRPVIGEYIEGLNEAHKGIAHIGPSAGPSK